MNNSITANITIPPELAGHRLDQALSILLPQHSRSRITQWIRQEEVLVNGRTARAKDKVIGGEEIAIHAAPPTESSWEPQNIQLNILYEDNDLLVINKPPGLVVHPAAGNPRNTLLNALIFHCPSLAQLPRAGIIHRLDKDTSGILIIAKTLIAHTQLVKDLQERLIKREYEAIVKGILTAGGHVEAPIGRHPKHRTQMAVVDSGKPALTHYRIIQRFAAHTHIRIQLETGRTHQIRVHMTHIDHAIIGDPVYGKRPTLPKACSIELKEMLQQFPRQALHAVRLSLLHPITKQPFVWEAPLPQDMQHLIRLLAEHKKESTT